MTASGRFWMLTSTSLIFLVRPMTAMLMKTVSRETTSFGASLRTMRMNGTFRGPLGTTTKPSSTTLDPKLMSPVGLGTSWTSQIRAEIREFFCEIRGGHKYMQQAHAVDFSQGGGDSKYKVLVIKDPPLPPGMPRVGVFRWRVKSWLQYQASVHWRFFQCTDAWDLSWKSIEESQASVYWRAHISALGPDIKIRYFCNQFFFHF